MNGDPAFAARIGALPQARRYRLSRLMAETPVPEGRIVRDLRVARIDDPVFARNAAWSLADIHWPDSLPYGYVEIPDAVVTPSGFVIAGDRLVFDTQTLPTGWMRGVEGGAPELIDRIFSHNSIHRLDVWDETCRLSLPPDMAQLDEAFLFNSRLACFNVAHLVTDTLIQVPTFHDCAARLGRTPAPLLAGPGFAFPIMPELFCLAAGVAPVLLRNRFHRVRRLFVPTTHFRPSDEAIARGAATRLRRGLAAALGHYREPVRRRLFISRDDSGRGADREPRFANADALHRALAREGVEPVVASRLGVEDYLRTFANAELIVGLHGAGLANAALAAEPRVVEIVTPGYPGWRLFAQFFGIGMGAPYRRVTTPPPADGVAEYDVAEVVAACRALLATSCPPVDPPL